MTDTNQTPAPFHARITVTCPDGQVRHEGTFATMAEAQHFASWGHLCMIGHRFDEATIGHLATR